MKSKLILGIAVIAASLIIGSQNIYANQAQNITNDIRGAVGTAEDKVEDAAKDAAGTVKEGLNTAGEAASNMVNDVQGGMKNDDWNNDGVVDNNNDRDNNYTARRTNANTNGVFTWAGWTWAILAVVALAIIGLVWYYMKQDRNVNNK